MSDRDETFPKILRLLDVMSLEIGSLAHDVGTFKKWISTLTIAKRVPVSLA